MRLDPGALARARALGVLLLVLAGACQRADRGTPAPLVASADSAPATAAAAWTRVANGDPSLDSLFVIKSGKVKVTLYGDSGREIILSMFKSSPGLKPTASVRSMM